VKKENGLILAALGVVFGDIGTSPLYALKECFDPVHGVALNPQNVIGICSLIFWSLTLVVVLKYIFFILKADNNGEGGIMSLLSLINRPLTKSSIPISVVLGIFGTALLYGDGVITPAISVLSAVEGMKLIAPSLSSFVVPLTVGILMALFLVQKHGTEKIGKFFGPILVIWFLTLAVTGVYWIFKNPTILQALNPVNSVKFFMENGLLGFLVL
jgi:KUP system potassium uptake protein